MKIGIAGVPIVLAPGAAEFSIQLRRPGVVRGLAFVLQKRLVMTAGEPEFEEQATMFVEADPDGPLRNRKFVLVPMNLPFSVKEGHIVKWAATGMSMHSGAIAHLFEIVEAE